MKLGKIIHLGVVVEDVEKAASIYEKNLGIGPFDMMDVSGGRGLKIKTAMYHGDG